jgi:flagellar basal body-associated protein FliL
MGAQAKPKQVGAVTSAIVVGGKRQHPHFKAKRRGLLIIGALLIVLIAAAVATFHFVHVSNVTPPATTKTPTKPLSSHDKALKQARDGNVSAAQATLDAQLKTAKAPQEKVAIYNQKIGVAVNDKQYDQAINWGTTAFKILPTSATAELVSTAYQGKNDITNAKLWLQKAIDAVDKNDQAGDRIKRGLQAELNGLTQ